jgi:hypothetical protein
VRKLWTLGALVTACAFGWRQGSATHAVELHAPEGPLLGLAPELGRSAAAERAVRRVVLSGALREMIAPDVKGSEAPFLPSMLEALWSQRPPSGAVSVGSGLLVSQGEPACGVRAHCAVGPGGPPPVGKGAPSDPLEALAELFYPSSPERPMPASR